MATCVYTARTVIDGALRAIGSLAAGETATAEDMADALQAMNLMLSGWSAERLTVYASTRLFKVLDPGDGTVTIGDYQGGTPRVGDIASNRPYKVEGAFVRDGSSSDSAVTIISLEQYNGLANKDTQGRPDRLYLSPDWPLATAYLYPVPDDSYALCLDVWAPLAAVANQADEIMFPPEYAEALKYNLAVRLALDHGRPIQPYLAKLAEDSKRVVKRQSTSPSLAGFDFGGRVQGSYNINVE